MNRLNRALIHQIVYLLGLALMLFCLPLSLYLISVAQFLLTLNWLLEGDFRRKAGLLRNNSSLIVFVSVFIIYGIGYFLSENKTLALFHLKNALPLLALPVIIGTSRHPGARNMHYLLLVFCAGVITTAIVCILNYVIKGIPPGGDFRQISIFIPHLRFAMMIVMAIVTLAFSLTYHRHVLPVLNQKIIKILLFSAILFLILFLFFLRSATGIVLLMAVAGFLVLHGAIFSFRRTFLRRAMIIVTCIGFLSLLTLILFTWYRNFHPREFDINTLEKYTENGNPYFHDTKTLLLENGNFTELYICESELQREWDSRSKFSYTGTDLRQQPVKSTLKRYLTSKGLRKDSLSVNRLTDEDIAKIESGLANYRFNIHQGIYQRLYETLYEIHVYKTTGFVEMHSFGQRLAYLQASLNLITENPLCGTGTGDVYKTLKSKVLSKGIAVDTNWEGKPHNQFAFYLIAFGIPGLLWILFCWIYPVFRHSASLLFLCFALIMLISMLVLDTHESYSTMAFFSVLYSMLIFGKDKPKAI